MNDLNVLLEILYPKLHHLTDYFVGQDETPEGLSDPYIIEWATTEVPQPSLEYLRIQHKTYATEVAAGVARRLRDHYMEEVDYVMGKSFQWAKRTPENQQAILTLGQDLLDVPQQATFPRDIVWPDMSLLE